MTKPDSSKKPLVLNPLGGPEPPDMSALADSGRKRHEAELAVAEKLTREARAGSPPAAADPPPAPREPPASGDYRVEFDWRGETAYYVEHDRRVRLECICWSGSVGHLAHSDGHWEYLNGRWLPLTDLERDRVLHQVVARARDVHNITLVARLP